VDGLLKSFETVQLARINQKELPHGCTLLLKRDNSAAGSSEIPPQREVGATSRLRVFEQIIAAFVARFAREMPSIEGFAAWDIRSHQLPAQTGTNCTSQPSNLRIPFATLAR
jgi:hypothetical protein